MLLPFLTILLFQQTLAFSRSLALRKPSSLIGLNARNVYRHQLEAAQIEGAIPSPPPPKTFRTFGEYPSLVMDKKLDDAKYIAKRHRLVDMISKLSIQSTTLQTYP